MKSLFLFLTIILFASTGFAQRKKIHFQSINTISFVGGDSPEKTGFGSTNGIVYSSWFAGIGAELDNYHFKTIPVFLDGRKYFGSENRLFIYGDLGANLPAQKKAGKEFYDYSRFYYSGGMYWAGGIGYLFPFIKKSSLLFSLGNSYKSMSAKTIGNNYCPAGDCAPSYRDYQFKFYRLVVKAGWFFDP
ncbi:MAG: hypothetical protein ACTHNG_11505 [Ginsengibacter sp.]